MDDFKKFLEENQYVPMKTDMIDGGRLVLTPYYINPFGEIGKKDNGEFRLLKYKRNDKDGYYRISININGKDMMKFIHRLVAQTFIPNPKNRRCINHKNRDKHDNSVDNLEWVTVLQNAQHEKMTRNLAEPVPDYPILQIKGIGGGLACIIDRYDHKKGLPAYTKGYTSKMKKAYVMKCCRGDAHTYHGYHWIYEKDLYGFKEKEGLTIIN